MSTIERAMRRLGGEPEAPAGTATAGEATAAPDALAAPATPAADVPSSLPAADVAPPASHVTTSDSGTSPSRQQFGRPTLELDFERLRRLGFLVPGDPASRLSEEFQQVKRRLIANATPGATALGTPANLIMVTSSMPGEGKTYTTMNLAMSIAMEIDRTVLAIDSDILKSDLSRLFGAFNRTGLYDYLAHPDLDLADIIQRTNVPTLSFVPAGTIRDGITERLASQAMIKLASELATRYADRLIIFDAPPVLAMSGAAALAPLIGQVVLVVEAYKTARETLKRTLSALEHVQITGLVLNKIRHQAAGGNYGYGYGQYGHGYGYGYGYGYGSQQPKS
ncbi:MAG: AAA family ATPase [Gammaproteobacteria bacterium]|nr:AAA family ATPase [Gammaproteobacteria bacterium]